MCNFHHYVAQIHTDRSFSVCTVQVEHLPVRREAIISLIPLLMPCLFIIDLITMKYNKVQIKGICLVYDS